MVVMVMVPLANCRRFVVSVANALWWSLTTLIPPATASDDDNKPVVVVVVVVTDTTTSNIHTVDVAGALLARGAVSVDPRLHDVARHPQGRVHDLEHKALQRALRQHAELRNVVGNDIPQHDDVRGAVREHVVDAHPLCVHDVGAPAPRRVAVDGLVVHGVGAAHAHLVALGPPGQPEAVYVGLAVHKRNELAAVRGVAVPRLVQRRQRGTDQVQVGVAQPRLQVREVDGAAGVGLRYVAEHLDEEAVLLARQHGGTGGGGRRGHATFEVVRPRAVMLLLLLLWLGLCILLLIPLLLLLLLWLLLLLL
eukprot:PhM_4_TR9795/c3_g1_i1/m.24136